MPATGEDHIQDVVDDVATFSDAAASSSSDEEVVCDGYVRAPTKTAITSRKMVTFESLPTRKDHEEFIRKCVDVLLKQAVFEGTDRKNKVLNYESPEELQRIFDFGLKSLPSTHEDLLQLVKDTVQYSVKTGHPYFVNQLFSSLDPYGLVAQWLTDALNPSVYTYEVSPVFTLMEETVLEEMRRIVGFKDGRGDGIFCPGGSLANGYAIHCARYNFMPDVKTKGLHSLPRLVLFTSEESHYSIKKLASFLGIGSDNVYCIQTDKRGKIKISHLREEIERSLSEGGVPFMVCATAGTTVLGGFDPIEEIADVCQEYNLWLHVDAAWGGGALMSAKHRGLMKGIERADSVTWNPHKLLTAPQQCSTLLLQHEGIMAAANSTHAAYLFQKDKFYDTKYDTGDKHIQCGRRADVLKFWFMWKAKGTSGLEKHIDKVFANAKYFLDNIKSRPGFELVLSEPECTNICFWYVPPSLRTADKSDSGYKQKLHSVAPKMKERMMKEGSMMVTYQAQKDYPNFFRIVFQNSGLEKSDMIHLIEEFERLGRDL
nr:cysteine sulfinic acid decarboxylase-like [Leptinotarsa decemlineata]WCN84857.1 aspartate 1-decarboxylase [Leptinotarsa decemlineata]